MKNEKGFTIIYLVVIIIIVSIAAAVTVNLISVSEKVRMREVTLNRIEEILDAIYGNTDVMPQTDFGYVADIGDLPGSLEDLIIDTGDPNWNGPYLSTDFDFADPEDLIKDAYGNPFEYDKVAGTISTAESSPINIIKKFEFEPYALTNSHLWGTIRDRDDNIPIQSDLENIVIKLTYTVDFIIEKEEPSDQGAGNGNPFKQRPPEDTTTYGRVYTINPNSNGTYRFSDVAVGNYIVQASHDLLGIILEKPVIIQPDWNNKADFRFNPIFPGYPGYGDNAGAGKLVVSYYELIIDGASDDDIRLANADTLDSITIDKMQVNWTNPSIFERFQKAVIDNNIVYDKSKGLGSGKTAGEISGAIVDIIDFTIQPLESGKLLELFWNMDISPKELSLKFILSDLTEIIVPPDIGGGGDVEDESSFLVVNYSELVINGSFFEGISISNLHSTKNIILDKIELSWSGAKGNERINNVKINDKSVWIGNSTSGTILDITDEIIPPSTYGLVVRFEFSGTINNKNINNIIFYMGDTSIKTIP